MSLFGAGDDHRPKVTQREMDKHVFRDLANDPDKNSRLNHKERERVEQMLEPLLEGQDSFHRGIDKHELDSAIHAMREHPHTLVNSSKKIDKIETELRKYLKK